MKKLIAADITFDPIEVPGGYQPQGDDIGAYSTTAENLISNVLTVLTIVAGLAFILWFLLGGLTWITAGGKSDKIENAKAMMTNGAIGLIVVAVSYAVVWIVGTALGIQILEPGELLNTFTF